ncbi:MAG: glycosyltransferase family 4 protein [Bacteroidetes bacterium]|nr:glycosyltransferase family 4 protein [Bacteroidota bacterium]
MDVGLMQKVVLITNIPTPYRIPLFNELNKQLLVEGMELHVIFSEAGYQRRKFEINFSDFKFPFTILGGGTITSAEDSEKTYFFYKGLWKALKSIHPNKVIVAGFSAACIITASYCSWNKVPFAIWSGSIQTEVRNNSWHRIFIRRQLIKRAKSFIAYGSLATEYLVKMGAQADKVYIGINTVDTTFFSEETAKHKTSISSLQPFTFTYLGYLVPRKNVSQVIDAASHLAKVRKDFKLQIIGDGESKKSLESLSNRLGLDEQIKFTGYKQKNEVPYYFANTNALLYQSDFDIWGLVLNEAMAAGLCCLATINAGATFDLIIENETGLKIDYSLTQKVAEKMNWMMEHPKEVSDMGKKCSTVHQRKSNAP